MSERFITHAEIADKLHLNANHVRDRLTKRPDFPRAFVFGGARRWKEEEIQEWIESRREARPGRPAAR